MKVFKVFLSVVFVIMVVTIFSVAQASEVTTKRSSGIQSKVTQQSVIKSFMSALNSFDITLIDSKFNVNMWAINEAIKISSNGLYNNMNELYGSMNKNFFKTLKTDSNGIITNDSINNSLMTYCGINLNNSDVGAITGYDAGGSNFEKNASDIVPESKNNNYIRLDDLYRADYKNFAELKKYVKVDSGIFGTTISFTKNGLTVMIPNYNSIVNDEKKSQFVNGMYNWWLESSLNLIYESYEYRFDNDSKVNKIRLNFYDDDKTQLANVKREWYDVYKIFFDQNTTSLVMNINAKELGDMDLMKNSNGGDAISKPESLPEGSFFVDRLIAHELTHAVMAANIEYFFNMPDYLAEGIAELTIGADDSRKNLMIGLLKNFYANGNCVKIEGNNGEPYAGGYILWRYFAKQVADVPNVEKISENNTAISKQRVEESKRFYDEKNFTKALELLNQAIEFDSKNYYAYYRRGKIYHDLQNYQQAIKNYSKSIEINTNFSDAYTNRGFSYYYLKNYSQAISDFNQAIKLNPSDKYAYNRRGIAYRNLMKYEQAIIDYNQAIKLDPSYSNAYNNRGLAYEYLQDYEQAISDYTKSIELNHPSLYLPYTNRGDVYRILKNYEQAIKDYSKAIEINLNYAKAYKNRGMCYQALRQSAKAQADFAKARQLGYNG